jgi:hypothetical protein
MSRILLVVDQMDTFEELADALHQEGGAEILWAHDSEPPSAKWRPTRRISLSSTKRSVIPAVSIGFAA